MAMTRKADFVIPFNLVMRIKDISEDELEDYVNNIQMALHEIFYSSDIDDDHFEVKICAPDYARSYKEYVYGD